MKLTVRQRKLLAYMVEKAEADSYMVYRALRPVLNARPTTADALRVVGQLIKAGLMERVSRGEYRITPAGLAALAEHEQGQENWRGLKQRILLAKPWEASRSTQRSAVTLSACGPQPFCPAPPPQQPVGASLRVMAVLDGT